MEEFYIKYKNGFVYYFVRKYKDTDFETWKISCEKKINTLTAEENFNKFLRFIKFIEKVSNSVFEMYIGEKYKLIIFKNTKDFDNDNVIYKLFNEEKQELIVIQKNM